LEKESLNIYGLEVARGNALLVSDRLCNVEKEKNGRMIGEPFVSDRYRLKCDKK